MDNPEDLLKKWEALPNAEPSEDWQNKLLQRAQTARRRKKTVATTATVFSAMVFVFLLINVFFISKTWQKHGDKPQNTREAALMAMSNQFLSGSPVANY